MKTIRILSILYFILISYILAGLSTTDIRRLLKDSKYKINTKECFCESCGHRIPLYNQFPIVSFILFNGKCRYCKDKIPKMQFFQEIFIFLSVIGISIACEFKIWALGLIFGYYEIIKLIFIVIFGKRQQNFYRQLVYSIGVNIALYCLFYSFSYFLQLLVIFFI